MSEAKEIYNTTRGKTIFRVTKNKDNPFVMIDRRPIENPGLSWRAKGILTYLVSRPDDWIVRLGDLVKRSPDGIYTVRGALKELTKAGHITRREERDEVTGRFRQYVLEVHELPGTCPPTNPPQADEPQAVNLTLKDTESIKNTKSNKKELIIINPITAQLFTDAFGTFRGPKEQTRWQTIYDSIGPDRAGEIISWASKKEIHLTNRPGLLDSLETAATNWKDKPGKKQSAAQSEDPSKYERGEYAGYLA